MMLRAPRRSLLPMLAALSLVHCFGRHESTSDGAALQLVECGAHERCLPTPPPVVEVLDGFATCRLAPANCLGVTNDHDNGPGSLRMAMERANAMPGRQHIAFDIAGSKAHVIDLQSPLPPVSDVTISGYSQPGSALGTADSAPVLQIVIRGDLPTNYAIDLRGGGIVAGLAIAGNFNAGVLVVGSGNHIAGNYLGVEPDGSPAASLPGVGITLIGSATVGGALAWQGNVLTARYYGIYASAGDSSIVGNRIGTDYFGEADLGDATVGIRCETDDLRIAGNTIAYNDGEGIAVGGFIDGIEISQNSIFGNTGLGIDLEGANGSLGVSSNDGLGDADGGANGLQNYPVLHRARLAADGKVTVQWGLRSSKAAQFRVEFFASAGCHESGYGEGERFVGSRALNTDASGELTNVWTLPGRVEPGQVLTATATDLDTKQTSEFSRCLVVPDASDDQDSVDAPEEPGDPEEPEASDPVDDDKNDDDPCESDWYCEAE